MAGLVAGTEDSEGATPELEDVNATDASAVDEIQGEDTADTPAAEPETGPKSMLDAVNTALDGKQEKSPASESGLDAEGKPKAPVADKDAEELTPEEEKLLPRKTQKSIERFRSQIGGMKQQLEQLQPKAESYERLADFVTKANLTSDDVNNTLEIARLVKNNQPAEAYEKLVPVMVELQRQIGLVLPPDLKQEVDQGYITEERAREISALRARGQLTEAQATEERNRSAAQKQQESLQTHVDTVAKSATEWENAKAQNDPDWNLKKDRVAELVELDMARRQRQEPGWFPKNSQEAIEMSEAALKRVNEELTRLGRPARREIRHVTGSASQSSRPKPKNLMDVINNTLATG